MASDETTGRQRLPAAQGGLDAPILFLDGVPVCGMRQGVFSLVIETLVQDGEDEARADHRVVVGRLRTTAEGIRSLKVAIGKPELVAATPAGGTH